MKVDSILILSFGGPEGPADVMPFLENVLRGKNVPEARKLEVAKHYESFGGVSPLNAQNRELQRLLTSELKKKGIDLPVFWGNRNWKPYLKETLEEMMRKGLKKGLVYVTSAYGSYSGCRQYLEDIAKARAELGDGAPELDKIRTFHDHPVFVDVIAQNIRASLEQIPTSERGKVHLAFTAHSIPTAMSATSPYLKQLQETSTLAAERVGVTDWTLVFQSRSGPPTQPWLEPDILTHLESQAARGVKNIVNCPVGFLSDHLEVIYDLDHQAKEKAESLGMHFWRSKTPGNDPKFVQMIVDLIRERLEDRSPGPDICAPDCCAYQSGRPQTGTVSGQKA